VATFIQNGWQVSTGMGGRFAPESPQKSIYQKLNINYDDLPIKKVIA